MYDVVQADYLSSCPCEEWSAHPPSLWMAGAVPAGAGNACAMPAAAITKSASVQGSFSGPGASAQAAATRAHRTRARTLTRSRNRSTSSSPARRSWSWALSPTRPPPPPCRPSPSSRSARRHPRRSRACLTCTTPPGTRLRGTTPCTLSSSRPLRPAGSTRTKCGAGRPTRPGAKSSPSAHRMRRGRPRWRSTGTWAMTPTTTWAIFAPTARPGPSMPSCTWETTVTTSGRATTRTGMLT